MTPKYFALFALFSILLVAGCVQLPWQQAGFVSYGTAEAENPDLYVKAETVPAQVVAGRNMTIFFELRNKQNVALKNLSLNIYDKCIFSGEEKWNASELKQNRSAHWNWKWTSQKTDFARDCEIKFRTSWTSEANVQQDIAVLSESEYTSRERAGTLSEITTEVRASQNPLAVSVSFSDAQPFMNSQSIYMYIDYENIADGFIGDLKPGNVTIKIPQNIVDFNCPGFSLSGDTALLNRTLSFIDKSAPRTTCSFTTNTSKLVDVRTFSITAKYKYWQDNSLTVKVVPK